MEITTKFSVQELECHECGKVAKGHITVWLDHLCQHFFALCPKCWRELKERIGWFVYRRGKQ